MNEYKSEPVFGDQSLFDGGPKDAEIAAKFEGGIAFFPKQKPSSKVFFVSGVELAMRRIIAEPKRWTVEDQKAGRLPEVGCSVYSDLDKQPATVLCVDNESDIWFQCESGRVRCTDYYEISPLETPEEKAEREEDEFVALITKCTSTDGYSSGYIEGVRAAYRKLKGGE